MNLSLSLSLSLSVHGESRADAENQDLPGPCQVRAQSVLCAVPSSTLSHTHFPSLLATLIRESLGTVVNYIAGRVATLCMVQPLAGRVAPLCMVQPLAGRVAPLCMVQPLAGRVAPLCMVQPVAVRYAEPAEVSIGCCDISL